MFGLKKKTEVKNPVISCNDEEFNAFLDSDKYDVDIYYKQDYLNVSYRFNHGIQPEFVEFIKEVKKKNLIFSLQTSTGTLQLQPVTMSVQQTFFSKLNGSSSETIEITMSVKHV